MLDMSGRTPVLVSEKKIVDKLKRMDSRMWEHIFENYTATLAYDINMSLRKRDLSAELADDILQETWLTAVEKIHEFVCDGDGKFYNWLRVIALNHVRNYWRKNKQNISFDALEETQSPNALDYFLQTQGLAINDVENQVQIRQQMTQLDQLLSELSPRDREIVVRRLIMDEKPEELAQRYPNLKVQSISQLICRVRKNLRHRMDD
ncbi:MAG: sigma-70 family RNA polymerase sigma factor [Chloroflexi bacterium]|nr:sigma-70 family RNA polymerase sigma factor [Chloroflexota bacterium]MCC6891378.1 sigma-70 family RNA polymerase sigma factor [Anaerolineae bacterium]